jgi:hypothetical protein
MPGKFSNRGGLWIKHRKGSGEQYLSGDYNAVCPQCNHEFRLFLVSFENNYKTDNSRAPDWILEKQKEFKGEKDGT